MNNLFWRAYSNEERHAAISKIQIVIAKHGDITSTQMFSDISLNIRIEIAELKVDALYNELSRDMAMETFEYLHSGSTKERVIFLNITFSKGTGDLNITVPSVPG